MLIPQMPDLPERRPDQVQSKSSTVPSSGAPKKLKRSKRPVSQQQRSRQARTNAKNAVRDAQGRFAQKHFFEHVFDGIEKAVGWGKKTHKKVKKATNNVKKAFRGQPRMRAAIPQRRKRKRAKTPAQVEKTQQQQRVPGYRGSVIRQLFRL